MLKTLLSQPRKRIHYLHQKMRSNMAALTAIFLVPLLLLSLCFAMFDHYDRVQAPVLANVHGLTSLEQMENTLTETEVNNALTYTLGTVSYTHLLCGLSMLFLGRLCTFFAEGKKL